MNAEHTPIPGDSETGVALVNIVNKTAWVHIDHNRDTSAQRVTAMTNDGAVLSEEATFVEQALVALERRLSEVSAHPFTIDDFVYSSALPGERGQVVDCRSGRGVLVKWDSYGREWESPEWLLPWEGPAPKRGGA